MKALMLSAIVSKIPNGVAPEMKEAGANYEDREVVVDDNLVTSREPADLPAFMREFMKFLR